MSFMNALMTYEPQHISEASAIIGRACDTIDKFRHKVVTAAERSKLDICC